MYKGKAVYKHGITVRIKGENICQMFASLAKLLGIQQIDVSIPFHNPLITVFNWNREREGKKEISASVSNSDELVHGRIRLKQLITAKFPEDLIFSVTLSFIWTPEI